MRYDNARLTTKELISKGIFFGTSCIWYLHRTYMKFPKKSAHGSLCCKLITSQVCIFRLKGKEGGNVFHSRFSLLANIPDIQM